MVQLTRVTLFAEFIPSSLKHHSVLTVNVTAVKKKKKYNYIYLFHDEKQGCHLIHMHHLQFISPASMIRGHEIVLKCRTLVWPDYYIKSNRYRGN